MNLYSNWSEVNELIDKALELEKGNRKAFLEENCGNNPELLTEAKDYLSFIERAEADEFLETTAATRSKFYKEIQADGFIHAYKSPVIGQRIGPYKIMQTLGEGGMGTVYLAERTDGEFDQQVAIKFLRGYYSPTMRDRFSREKQILARLNHPNIASLIDGGITDDGTPYMIMEYVDGTPVDDYCRTHSLRLSERLTVFLQICRAVQHAHSKLIIHRDLKPENIFITGDGQVKVMDFGIAKFLNSELDDKSLVQTQEGYHVASVEFAAPEQFQSSEPSTATDVYGLGVLLYLLLTGEKPFVFKGKSLTEIEKIVHTEPPPQPRRHSNPAIGAIPSDLESIILKALRKEPERRYESVVHLREEIERYQKGLPVLARKGTLRYKSAKFLKRNKTAFAVGAIFLLVASGFAMYHIQRLTEERNISQAEAEKARAVTGFLTGIFEHASPYKQPNSDITAREILDLGTNFIQNETSDQPEIQSSLLSTVGGIYQILGDYDKSEQLLKEALELEQSVLTEHQGDEYGLAVIHHNFGNLKTSQGNFSDAIDHHKKAAAIFNQLDLQGYRAGSLSDWGWNEYLLANYPKADSLFQLALPLNEEVHGKNSSENANTLRMLGWLYHDQGNYQKADSLFSNVLTIQQGWFSDDHPQLATTIHSLGWVKYQLQQYEEASSLYEEAIEMRRRIFDNQPHHDIAWSLNNFGMVRQAQGRYDEAEQLFENALQMRRDILPDDHPHISQSLGNLGSIYFYKEQYDLSISIFREVVEIQRNILGTDHPNLAMYINNLGTVLSKAGHSNEAIPYYIEAIEISEEYFSRSHPSTLQIWSNLADAYEDLNKYNEAEIVRIDNFEALRNEKGISDPKTQLILQHLIQLYEKWGNTGKQREYRRFLADSSES